MARGNNGIESDGCCLEGSVVLSSKEFWKKDAWGANGDDVSETEMAVGCSGRVSLTVTSAVLSCVVVLVVVTTVGGCSLQPENVKQTDTVIKR